MYDCAYLCVRRVERVVERLVEVRVDVTRLAGGPAAGVEVPIRSEAVVVVMIPAKNKTSMQQDENFGTSMLDSRHVLHPRKYCEGDLQGARCKPHLKSNKLAPF